MDDEPAGQRRVTTERERLQTVESAIILHNIVFYGVDDFMQDCKIENATWFEMDSQFMQLAIVVKQLLFIWTQVS